MALLLIRSLLNVMTMGAVNFYLKIDFNSRILFEIMRVFRNGVPSGNLMYDSNCFLNTQISTYASLLKTQCRAINKLNTLSI